MQVPIIYQSVIVHPGNVKVNDRYEGIATKNESIGKLQYGFSHQSHGFMQIKIEGDSVQLIHEKQLLPLQLFQYREYAYQSPYGMIDLKTYLKKLEIHPGRLSLIYELYENENLISTCYLRISEGAS